MHPAHRPTTRETGFTLLELVFTVVILGALAKFAMMKLLTPATMTLPVQAQSVVDLIRRAQSLAVVRGQRMRVSVTDTSGTVAIACASAPCTTDTSLTVSQGAVLAGSANPIYFNSLGQPMISGVNGSNDPLTTDATFTLSYQTGCINAKYIVTVAKLTGSVWLALVNEPVTPC
jgi:prepilin-type N-terminal cleavage/methylation domain-containing protein